MKRLFLTAALLAALTANAQLAHAAHDEEIEQLQEELELLRDDDRVLEFAIDELEIAEDYVDELASEPPGVVDEHDLIEAERLITAVERAAGISGPGLPRGGRDTVIVIDDDDDEEVLAARDEAEAARLEAEAERAANARLRAELGQAQTRVTDRGLVLTLGDVLFAVGKSDLKPGATRTLDKLIVAMKRDRETRVTIEGHTDSTGGRAYNIDLSKRRAAAVRSYLTRKGITADRIVARGLGPDFPVATNANEAGRQQNRRVEVLVQNDDD